MSGIKQSILDNIEMELTDPVSKHVQTVYIDVHDNSLSRKWLTSLNTLLTENYHLEKNYCFLGFADSLRSTKYICDRINTSIAAVNAAELGYTIDDNFTIENTITAGDVGIKKPGGKLIHSKFNWLHRYFEDLQGISGAMSPYYTKASNEVRWHIRQLNLLCHEYESLVLSVRKEQYLPFWQRPSQLMCWLNAPRFVLDDRDYELFGIDSLNRELGGVFAGVNKAVGKHHWEVYCDEGADVSHLVTSTLRSQTEAAGDFDIEWANNPAEWDWMKQDLIKFRQWLIDNNFDPDNKALTIGHPKVGQVDLIKSFGSTNYVDIWKILGSHLNVTSIKTNDAHAAYTYNWSDVDYMQQQIAHLK